MPIVILLHILLLSLSRYIAWPENFVWPYLNFQGLTLYKDIFFIYPPLYFLLLAGFYKLAGISLLSLQIFSYLIIAGTDILVFFAAGKKIWPVVVYILLQLAFEGNGMWPDQLLAPILILAYLALRSKRYFSLGLMLGLALATKQTAAYAVVLMAAMSRNLPKVFLGAAIPLGLVIVYVLNIGAGGDFLAQVWTYILSYHAGNKLQQLWPTLGQMALLAAIFLPAIVIGVVKKKYLLVGLVITASLGMFTRFSYFHLQPALPFLALLIAESKFSFLALPAAIFFLKVMLMTFGVEPKFLGPDELNNAHIINQSLRPGEKTLILTPSDHYYWLTQTRPVGNYFTTSTPWNLSYPGVSEKIVKALIVEKPKFVVIKDAPKNIGEVVKTSYRLVSKLSDGSGIFEYDPVGLR